MFNYDKSILAKLDIAFASGDRITTENEVVYYDYFNTHLRWLCGFNNDMINDQIQKDVNFIQSNKGHLDLLIKQVNSILLEPIQKNYNLVNYYNENTFKILNNTTEKELDIIFLTDLIYPDKDNFKNFFDEIDLDIPEKEKNKTEEGWSKIQIKKYFKTNRKKIGFFVLSPFLIQKGIFISNETIKFIEKLCSKYKISFIWDESLTGFFRSGKFYLLEYYNVVPDYISINAPIYQDSQINILILNKKIKRKQKKLLTSTTFGAESKIILLHSILHFLSHYDMKSYIKAISNRLEHKLKALQANFHNRFSYKVCGLICLLNFSLKNYAERIFQDFVKKHSILYYNTNESIILLPQIILTSKAVDLFIQNINDFFKEGIKLSNSSQ